MFLEFSQKEELITDENVAHKVSVTSFTEWMTWHSEGKKIIKNTVIDQWAHSMRDNLVFSGIPEKAEEGLEITLKDFTQTRLKLPEETGKTISFHGVPPPA